jgi:hypothetical protein
MEDVPAAVGQRVDNLRNVFLRIFHGDPDDRNYFNGLTSPAELQ